MEHLYRHLVENSLGLMCAHDLEGVLLYVSPAAAQALGWAPADGVGKSLRDYLAPAARPFFGAYLERIRKNPTDTGLMLLAARDGSEQIWSYRNIRLDEPGHPPCVLGHAVDITEQVRTRQALLDANLQLQERDARHATLVEDSPVAIGIEQDGLLRFANGAFARIHGHGAPDALVGRSVDTLVADRERDRVDRARAAAARGERAAGAIEVEHVRHDGASAWVEQWWSLVTWERRPALLSTLVDVSDRKDFEARIRQMEQVEALGRFAGGVAHHLNNLMTVVLGWAELLRDSLDEGDPRRAHGDMVLEAGDRAATIARQLLAFSRRQIMQPRPVHLGRFLAHLAPRVRQCVGAGVSVEISVDAEPWEVRADTTHLEHAMLALADNARDAMPAGGRLVLRAGNAEVPPAVAQSNPGVQPGDYAVLAVEDSGVGMTDEVKSRLFEPFFSTKRIRDRAGLGLASVYGVVRQHEGFVDVDSRPGVGTTVRIYLPRHSATRAA